MNEVWIVTGGFEYEGESVLTVHAAQEGAEVYADEARCSRRYDYVNVVCYDLLGTDHGTSN